MNSYAVESFSGTVHTLSHTDPKDVIMAGVIPPWEPDSKYFIAVRCLTQCLGINCKADTERKINH